MRIVLALLTLLFVSVAQAQTPLAHDALARNWSERYRAGDFDGVLHSVEANLLSGHPDADARFVWCSIEYSLGRLTPEHMRSDDPRLAKVLGNSPEVYLLNITGGPSALGERFATGQARHSKDFVTLTYLGYGAESTYQYADTLTSYLEGDAPPAGAPADGPSLFTALQEQVGLKLQSTTGPVQQLVIKGVERPSEN